MARLKAVGTAVIASLVLTATGMVASAEAATPGQVTQGYGWKLMNPDRVTSLAPGTYYVEFASEAARTRLTPYLKANAAETQRYTPGVSFVVTTRIQKMTDACAANRTIVVSLSYRPVGLKGMSNGSNCYGTVTHSLYSGKIKIDTEWWYKSWFSTNPYTNEYRIKNGMLHEFGHAIGLGHPNYDRDRDGSIEGHECVRTLDGWPPVLCSPNGGWVTSKAGKYTSMDAAGLRALTTNWAFR